jgi:hypothetical protein
MPLTQSKFCSSLSSSLEQEGEHQGCQRKKSGGLRGFA